jgi:hypothetical protein
LSAIQAAIQAASLAGSTSGRVRGRRLDPDANGCTRSHSAHRWQA